MLKRTILVVALLSLIFLLTGCDFRRISGGNNEGPLVRVTGTPAEMEKESASFNRVFLPIKFPEDLPIYPSSKLLSSEVRGEDSGFVVFSVKLSPPQITKYYEENLAKLGWAIEAKSNDGKNFSFLAVKNNKASTIGIRFVNESEILLTITYGPQ